MTTAETTDTRRASPAFLRGWNAWVRFWDEPVTDPEERAGWRSAAALNERSGLRPEVNDERAHDAAGG